MSLRFKLIVAFLLLSVVPLGVITVYSYYSSIRAFRGAVQAESAALAEEMRSRMDSVRRDLGSRVERLGTFPFRRLLNQQGEKPDPKSNPLMDSLMAEMGDAAKLLDSIEFRPVPPGWAGPGMVPPPIPPPPPSPKGMVIDLTSGKFRIVLEESAQKAVEQAGKAADQAKQLQKSDPLASGFGSAVRADGQQIGTVTAHVSSRQVFRQILSRTRRRQGEIPFVIDAEGKFHTADPLDQARLQKLPLQIGRGSAAEPVSVEELSDWMVVTREDQQSHTTYGIARPIAESLKGIRNTAAWNLGLGLGLAVLALAGILPLSTRMTRNLGALSRGAEELGLGRMETRVAVRSRDEIGRLAETFNRMADEIGEHQKLLVEQERLRKELELSRRIQAELLPRNPLHAGLIEAKGISIPAREVGGDFFNYFQLPEERVAILVGDVAGKGVAAALLMANIQATLQARLPLSHDLADLARHLNSEIESNTPPEAYLTLFMGVLDTRDNTLRFVSAGHHPQFALRADGSLNALESSGRPLGLLPGGDYVESSIPLSPGDALFLYTDGLVEAENAWGNEFGYQRMERLLIESRRESINAILARMEEEFRKHRGTTEASDDATMLVLKVSS